MKDARIPEIPVSTAIKQLADIYTPLITGNCPYDMIPSPFLWGPPGVGKSEGIHELADILEKRTGKTVKVTDIRLLLFSPIDLRGVPVADESRNFTDWLMPRILDFDDSSQVVNILFLDELSAAPQSVQAAAYQITLNRAIGEHQLPDNTIVIAAGNRTTDRSVAYKMPSALANRMMHFDICVDFSSWANWAVDQGNINPFVLGYLSYDVSKLYLMEKDIDEVAFPTPRSWVFVSNILNTLGDTTDISQHYIAIASCIGMATALEFINWTSVYSKLPSVPDIINGKNVVCPSAPDELYALSASLCTYLSVREKSADALLVSELENFVAFVNRMPADYVSKIFLTILGVESIQKKLMKVPDFLKWAKTYGKVIGNYTGFRV